MKHFFQRMMLVAMVVIASVCNVKADDLAVGTYTYNQYSSTYYYGFTSATDCQLTVSFSGDWNYASFDYYWSDNNGSSWEAGSGSFGSWASSQTFDISAGKTYALYLGSNYSSQLTMTVSSTCGGGGPTPPTAQPGENPENAIELSVGNSTKDVLSGKDTWYKVSVPAGYCVKYSVSYMLYGNTTKMYAGKANADAKTNAIGSSNSGGADSGQGDNTTSSAVDYYICLQANAVYGSPNFTVSLEDLGSINDAKSIGTLQFDIANKANVGTATSSVLVTFPSFVGGALSEYNMAVLYTVSELTDEWYNNGSVVGYYRVLANGTASAGVQLPLPTLVDGKKYQVRVDRVDVTNGNLGKDFSSANSVSFAVTNIPDGSEGNPFIITEAGVAGPDHSATYGNWTWYKYIVPSDGKVTISHTWSNTTVNTLGFIRVNGEQVRSNVPETWSQGCSAGDVIMVAMATEKIVSDQLVKGSVTAPAEGETRALAKMLNVGDNSILKVGNGAMSRWYKFNLAANYEATLTFNGGIAAKYYIGSSATGTNIDNNEEGLTELVYLNESASAVDVFVEVTGTNTLVSPSATLSLEDKTPAPTEDPVFVSALNNNNANGSSVSALENAFFLQANATVSNASDNSKFHLMRDDMWIADAVFSYPDGNQAVVIFEGLGFSESGVYKVVVDAGAATIGGTACAAAEFVWTIGGSSSGCDAAKATDEVNIISATNGGNAAGAAGITAMSRDFELTCDLAGLTRYNSEVGVKLVMPWDGGTYDITSSITNWNFDCDKITFSLNYDIDASYLNSAGNWKLTIYEESFLGATEDIYSAEASFTWTVAPAVVYNAPVLVGATNSGVDAGGKVAVLSEDFYITLSEPSRYTGNRIYYWYDGATDWNASVAVTMSDDKTVARVNVTGADLTREGTHSINITYGAFVNAFDETKVLTAGRQFDWTVGAYTIRDVRNGSVVGHKPNTTDEVDRPFFQNQFTVTLSAASVAANPFVATLKKNGAAYLSNAKVTATSGMEFVIEFQDWPHTTSSLPIKEGTTITGYTEVTTYNSLEPADYTLTLAAGDFTSGADQSTEWSGTWHVVNMVYAWSLDVKGCVNGNNTTMDQKKPELAPNFTIAFQEGLSNARVGEEKISLQYQPEGGAEAETIFEEPTQIQCSNGSVTVTFGTENLKGNGMYTVIVPKNAIMASYTPEGGSMPVETGNASGSFTWTVENNYSFTMPESGWDTYTVDYKSQWPSGCTVYYVADMKEGKVLLKQARYHAGESDERNAYMPAYTPLVVKGKAGEKYTVYRPIDDSYMTNFADNLLEGTVTGAAASESYVLEGAAFVKKNEAHAAHSAWLPTDGLSSEKLTFCFTEEEFNPTTGCEQVKLLNDVKKTMINGTLVIIRDGKMYNALGAKMGN